MKRVLNSIKKRLRVVLSAVIISLFLFSVLSTPATPNADKRGGIEEANKLVSAITGFFEEKFSQVSETIESIVRNKSFRMFSLLRPLDTEGNGSKTLPSKVVGKRVCIDPGHQTRANLAPEPIAPGSSRMKEKCRGGTRGISSGIPEYKITLQIAFKLKNLLERSGIAVVMTRETDDVNISNIERATIANGIGADLFIRIHCDGSSDPSVSGITTFYPAKNQWTESIYSESLRAARLVQRELVKSCNCRNNGIMPRGDFTGFNWSKVPVILTEVGFLTNPEEDRLLNGEEYQWKVAQGIHNGVMRYFAIFDRN
ncbi:MAG: N-acetylmuramoyl-L-alanine amidase [Actinomycetota bacterium]